MYIRQFKGVVFVLSLFLTSFFGAVFFLLPFLCLVFIYPSIYRKLVDALIENFLGITVVLEIDPNLSFTDSETMLILMNHYSRVDWLFFWSCLFRMGILLNHKIVLKAPLKTLPGAGWAMQMANFIFINRKWEQDQHILSQTIEYFASLNYPCKIVLFPEGTDFSPNNIQKSKEYSKKHNLPIYNYLLQPRTTGLTYMIKEMHNNKIIDVTVSYHHKSNFLNEKTAFFQRNIFHDNAYSKVHNLAPRMACGWSERDELVDSPCTEYGFIRGQYPGVVKFSCRNVNLTDLYSYENEGNTNEITCNGKNDYNNTFTTKYGITSHTKYLNENHLVNWCRSLWSSKDRILQNQYKYCRESPDKYLKSNSSSNESDGDNLNAKKNFQDKDKFTFVETFIPFQPFYDYSFKGLPNTNFTKSTNDITNAANNTLNSMFAKLIEKLFVIGLALIPYITLGFWFVFILTILYVIFLSPFTRVRIFLMSYITFASAIFTALYYRCDLRFMGQDNEVFLAGWQEAKGIDNLAIDYAYKKLKPKKA